MLVTSRYSFAVFFLTLSFASVSTQKAFALSGKLESAGSLMLSVKVPRDKVRSVLERSDCDYISGSFVNAKSTLHYNGGEAAVLAMAKELSQIEGMKVHFSFTQSDQASDWHLIHDSRQSTFQIILNLNSKRLDFEKLQIPVSTTAD